MVGPSMVVTASLAHATREYYTFSWEWYFDSYRRTEDILPSHMGSLWWTASLTNPSSLTIEFLEHSGVEQVVVWQQQWSALCGCPWGGFRAVNNSAVGKVPYTTAIFTNGGRSDFDIQLTGPAAARRRFGCAV